MLIVFTLEMLKFQITGQCYVFEPCFSKLDKDVVIQFGCNLIPENEVGFPTTAGC